MLGHRRNRSDRGDGTAHGSPLPAGNDTVAAGFLVFALGETLVVSGAAMDLATVGPVFAAGSGLWAASVALVSAPRVMPAWVRLFGAVGALLFAVVALQLFAGGALTPLSQPLPFFAYPFLVVTLLGWAWVYGRDGPEESSVLGSLHHYSRTTTRRLARSPCSAAISST